MLLLNSRAAREFGRQLAQCVASQPASSAYALLEPVLEERTPFRLLDPGGSFEKTRACINQASAWFSCDCFGECNLGRTLTLHFAETLTPLSSWRVGLYRKAAWAVEILEQDIGLVYHKMGLDGLKAISSAGETIGRQIENYIQLSAAEL